jgi:hypothetical protein
MLVPFLQNGKYGFVQKTNQQPNDISSWQKLMVIPIQFQEVTPFDEGLASVSLDGKMWGLIDETGKIIADFIYNFPIEIFNGIPYIQDDDRNLNRLDGKIENVPIVEEIAETTVYEIEQKLFVNVLREFPSPLFNRVAQHLFKDYFWVLKDKVGEEGWGSESFSGVIRLSTQEIIIPTQYRSFYPYFTSTSALFFVAGLKFGTNQGILNIRNEVVFPFENDGIFHFDNRFLMVENKKETYLMDYNFKRIPNEIAKEIRGFNVMSQSDTERPMFMAGDGSVGWTDESRQNVLYQNHDACDIMLCENTDYRWLISRDWTSSFYVDSSGKEVFRYPSRKMILIFFKEHNYKILLDEFKNKHLLDADFQEIKLSESPIQEICILNNGTHFLITHKNKKNALFDKNVKRIKLPKNKFLNCRGSFFIFTQQIEGYHRLSGSCDLNGKIITPCEHLDAQFQMNNNDANIIFKERHHLIRCTVSENNKYYYWTDFEHNVVYKS